MGEMLEIKTIYENFTRRSCVEGRKTLELSSSLIQTKKDQKLKERNEIRKLVVMCYLGVELRSTPVI